MNLKTIYFKAIQNMKKGFLFEATLKYLLETRFRFLINTFFYNKIYSRVIKKKAKKIKFPSSVNIETTNLCNGRCVFCPRTKLDRKKGFMSREIFKIIINKLIKENIPIKTVYMHGFGEPLLDPLLFERIKYVKKNTPYDVVFFTNGQLLNKENIKKTIESGVDEVNVSFNAMFKNDYEKVMGLDYDKTAQNIKDFVKIRSKMRINKPKIYISCVYSKKYNFDERKFRKKWNNIVDSIFVLPAEVWGSIGKKDTYSIDEYGYKAKKWPCCVIWKNAFISIEGHVYLCCKDFNGDYVMGDLTKKSFKDIWNSKKFKNFRGLHLQNKYDKIPICKDCEGLLKSSTRWLS